MNDLIKINNVELLGTQPVLQATPRVWIAGGAIRQWFCKESASDIDVFGASEDDIQQFIKSKLAGAKKLNDTERLKSFNYQGQLVQIITHRYYSNMSELVDSFDFTLCQFVWDGVEVFATQGAIISVLRKHLRVHKITKEYAADSLRRAFKYQSKGYKPCHGTILDLALSFENLKRDEIISQVEMSPGGGKRLIGID